ncbi:class I adenylate-forming enzyme family protein [Kocuria sp. M1N1S27]|uniref:class I adenylate-forming enzyme family protein n=1 Tax=Kocuria kalidii TaxID=3376283 RepID=UPI0037B75397
MDRVLDADSTASAGLGGFPGLRYGELVERRALRQPARTAIIHDGEHITYGQLLTRIRAAAAFLAARGVGAGDRVVCFAENRPEVLIALYACSRIGAVFTPLGISSRASEVQHVLEDLSAHTLLVSTRSVPTALEAVGTADLPLIQLEDNAEAAHPCLPQHSQDPAPEVVAHPGAPALIVYTSGTSGRPKGVVLTHGALFFNGVNVVVGLDIVSEDVTLVNTPLSHIAALNTLAVATLYKGGTVVLDSKFDPGRCLDQIARYGVSTMFAVPSMLTLLSQHPGFAEAEISSLRWILGGGAPMPPDLVAQWSARGVPVLASYGMTEAGPSISFRRRTDAAGKPGSSGPPALLTDVRILSADGEELPVGQTGEIRVRGPHTASAYWANEAATEATFQDGWLVTGDRGYLDADGDLCITGRSKEIIITGGENVDPAEVEHLISRYPGVLEAAVVGRPDPLWGEAVTAVVVSAEPVDLQDLREFLRPHLAGFKLPRQLERRDHLPRSAVGKLLRKEIQNLPPDQEPISPIRTPKEKP